MQGRLAPERFNELLNGPSSYRISYLQAHLCPNKGERGGHVLGCPVCQGIGYYWRNVLVERQDAQELTRAGYDDTERLYNVPQSIVSIVDENGVSWPPESITVEQGGNVVWAGAAPADYTLYTVTYATANLRAAVQGVTTQREFATRGEYEVLDLQITVDRHLSDNVTLNPAWDAGENDRFVLLDTWRRYSQHLTRGAQDMAVYRRIRAVTLSSVVNGTLVEWVSGTDYTIADGAVTWLPGRGPKDGTPYALEGQVSPEYYVFQVLPQTRQADGLDLPRRFVLRGFERHPSVKDKPLVRVEP
jgi:hypothetical protein